MIPHSATGLLTVSLAAIAANYRLLAARAPQSRTAAAVKANAYGLGMAEVAPALARAGCAFFYVAHPEEGIALRGILNDHDKINIAVLHGINAKDYAAAEAYQLIPVLCDPASVHEWGAAARARQKTFPVIIHLDTGMNRLGLGAAETADIAAHPEYLGGLNVKFWLSHLACADEPQHPLNIRQLAELTRRLQTLPPAPVSFANSSGIFLGAAYHFDQTRPGCALYGINPTPALPSPMHPVVRLQAPILQLRPLEQDASVGYGASWRSKRLGKLAVLPVGYADGFMRALSNRGTVHFGSHAAPIVGRVSMDLITVDVTDVPEALCQQGMLAELFGTQQDADAVAMAAGTIGYEVLTGLGARYRRVYEGCDVDDQSAGAAGAHIT